MTRLRCPGCRESLAPINTLGPGYVYARCDCAAFPYTHLVRRGHQGCHAGRGGSS